MVKIEFKGQTVEDIAQIMAAEYKCSRKLFCRKDCFKCWVETLQDKEVKEQ